MRKFDWDDILLMPTILSDIDSRSSIRIKKNDTGKLPLFVSPMDTVVDLNNVKNYLSSGFEVCLPRDIKWNGLDYELDNCFFSYGLDEMIEIIKNKKELPDRILIDIASGHLRKLYNTIVDFRKIYPDKILMVGNIANPETFKVLSEAGASIIRCGIGNGNGCLTTKNVSIGYPMASLVKECYEIKKKYDLDTLIVSDGGFKEYSDVIKSLAIGSDYVMLGSILNKTIESSGPNYIFNKIRVHSKIASYLYKKGFKVTKKFRGMSTKEVQRKWGRDTIKTSEGVIRYRLVEYTLDGWLSNFSDYLRSSMSYCGSSSIEEFIGGVKFNFITDKSYNRFNK